jgi:DNA-binding CsgD family transcriptional regulator
MRFDLALLRARVLLRLGRADRAIECLRDCAFVPTIRDGIVSAKMLLGISYVRLGQHDRGLALLDEADKSAADSHITVRAELTLNRGIAKYLAGCTEEAEALLAAVPEGADIVRARALEYRGWIACSSGMFEAASSWFWSAFECMRSCRWRDRFVEASVLQGLATISSELLNAAAWPEVEERIRAFDWNADGLGMPRFWVAIYCATISEMLGKDADAWAWARQAERRAPNEGYKAIALCHTAALFRGAGEYRAHLEFTLRAQEAYHSLDVASLGADQRRLPLFIAEELAKAGEFAGAQRLAAQYREVVAPGRLIVAGDDRFTALEQAVYGCIADAEGDRSSAVRCLASALRLLRKAGYRRQAVEVALRLARITGSPKYLKYAASLLGEVSPRYWIAREVRALQSDAGPLLTKNQRAILTLVARGKTYKEIGTALGRSWKTVANTVEQLRAKFGAGTRGELVALALRQGVIGLGHETAGRSG